jgi:hypothetical protein
MPLDSRTVLKVVNEFISATSIIYQWISFSMDNRKYFHDVYSGHGQVKDEWSHSSAVR